MSKINLARIQKLGGHLPASVTRLHASKSKMKLVTAKGTLIVSKSDIVFLKSNSNYCEVFFVNGDKLLCSQTLKSIMEKINTSNFYRIHASYLINLDFLTAINASYTFVKLQQEIEIPISRSKKADLKNKLEIWFD